MTSGKLRIKQRVVTLIVAAALGMGLGLAERGISADANPLPEHPGLENSGAKYLGAESCALCHAKSDIHHWPSELATLEEFTIWHDRDKHRTAFAALKGWRAEEMETLLRWKHGDAAKNRQCLACHAIDLPADPAGPILTSTKLQDAALAEGVSCEACHGRASTWIDRHWKRGEWSELKPPDAVQKYDLYGMTNLHDPARRTELCLSCHLGDIAAGKFVTHDMFAAGHPPLPAFEVESFLEQMPPHWRPSPPLFRTKSVAIEGLIAMRASVQLVADANRPSQSGHADVASGDFAIYDCTSCHHELKIPSSRQERGYSSSAPGRPPLRSLNSPLAAAALRRLSSGDDHAAPTPLDDALAELKSATLGRPFGDAEFVAAAALKVTKQLDQAIASLKDKPPEPQLLVERICLAGARAPLDYESAWQLTGALRAIVADMEPSAPGEPATQLDPKIKSLIEEMSGLVHFPAARDVSTRPETPYGDTLWSNGTDFDSVQFQKKLEEIVRLLGAR